MSSHLRGEPSVRFDFLLESVRIPYWEFWKEDGAANDSGGGREGAEGQRGKGQRSRGVPTGLWRRRGVGA